MNATACKQIVLWACGFTPMALCSRPFDLDEAMYRRISEVFEFKAPSHIERRQIWDLVTEHESIPCDEGIDWDAISLQYELTGGCECSNGRLGL